MNEGQNKNEYSPRLGETNRYLNAPFEFKEKINKEAVEKVKFVEPLLEKLEANPRVFCFHDPIAGSRWIGHYLMEDMPRKMEELYGTVELEYVKGVPGEVLAFIMRIKNFKEKIHQDPSIIDATAPEKNR